MYYYMIICFTYIYIILYIDICLYYYIAFNIYNNLFEFVFPKNTVSPFII